jgi:hypothetical protein
MTKCGPNLGLSRPSDRETSVLGVFWWVFGEVIDSVKT